jgi:hypothetical protein
MGRLTQLLLSTGQPTATHIRSSGFSNGLDDLLEATDGPTLEAFLIWRSVAHLLRWRPDLHPLEAGFENTDEQRKIQMCHAASYEYFPEIFSLADQLAPSETEEASEMSSFKWVADRIGNLRELLLSLHMSPRWADILAEAEPVFSGNNLTLISVNRTEEDAKEEQNFLQKILTAEKTQQPDPRVAFLADFLAAASWEPVWLENRFYRLYLGVRLRLGWLMHRVAASEFAAFSAQLRRERGYAHLALGLTLDLVDQVVEKEEEEQEDYVNFLHFGPLSRLEQFYLLVGSEACHTSHSESLLTWVQAKFMCL